MPDKNNEWNKMRKIDKNVEKKRMKIRSYQINSGCLHDIVDTPLQQGPKDTDDGEEQHFEEEVVVRRRLLQGICSFHFVLGNGLAVIESCQVLPKAA